MKTMKRLLALLLALSLVMPNCLTIASAYSEELTEELVEEIVETPEEVVEEVFEEEEIIEEVEEYQASDDLAGETSQDVTVTCEEYHYVPDLELPSDEEMFRGYVNSVLNPGQSVSLLSDMGLNSLGYGSNAYEAYCALFNSIAYNDPQGPLVDIAEGRRAEAVITTGYEAEYYANYQTAFTGEDLKLLLDALLTDLPFHLYWFDKTEGVRILSYDYGNGNYMVEFYFTVSHDYANQDILTNYYGYLDMYCTTDLAKTGAACQVAQYAQEVAMNACAEEQEWSYDYQYMEDYYWWIRDNVTYNYEAAGDDAYYSTVDTDPWQMIYVFDQDPETNVVCEGYAKAFEYLCDIGMISGETECYSVTGDLYQDGENLGAHMWNLVILDGSTYLVDVTNEVFVECAASVETVTRTDDFGTAQVLYQTVYSNGLGYEYDVETTELFGNQLLRLSDEPYDPINHPEPDPDYPPEETEPEPEPEPEPDYPEEDIEYDVDSLQAALNDAALNGETVVLENPLAFDQELTIPEGVTLRVKGFYLHIQEGGVLRIEGEMILESGSIMEIDGSAVLLCGENAVLRTDGGSIDNYGVIEVQTEGAVLSVEDGAYSAGDYSDEGTINLVAVRYFGEESLDRVSGVDQEKQKLYYIGEDASVLNTLAALAGNGNATGNYHSYRVNVDGTMTVSEATHLYENGSLAFAPDGELVLDAVLYNMGDITVRADAVLRNNAGIYMSSDNARLIVKGTVYNGADISTEGTAAVVDFSNGTYAAEGGTLMATYGMEGNVSGVDNSQVILCCYTAGDVSTIEAVQAQVKAAGYAGASISINADLEIPAGSELVIEPTTTLVVKYDCTLTNNGKITNNGNFYLSMRGSSGQGATLINNGTVANYGTIVATAYSHVSNNGTVENNDGATLDRSGTWDGNEPVVPETYTMTQDEFEAALAQNQSYSMFGGSVLIERDLVIDNWVSLFSDAKIVVGPGVTLTLNESSNIQGGALVLKGGTLVLNSTLSLGRYPGYTTVFDVSNGTLSFGVDGYIELSGADSVSITGEIPKENFVRYEYASTAEQLLAALEVDSSPYRKYNITVSSAVSLPGGTEIPAGTTVSIEMGGTLTFEGDAVNNGSIGVYEESSLIIAEGYVLVNNGTVRNMGGTITGTIQEGDAPADPTAQDRLQEQLNGENSWIQLEENVTITGTVTIPQNKVLYIADGVTLTVAEGGELVNNGNIQTNNGIINVAGTLTNNRLVVLQTFGSGVLNVTGTLVNHNSLLVIGGKAVCTGTYSGNGSVTWDIHAEVTGMPVRTVQSIVYSEEELRWTLEHLAAMEGSFYSRTVLLNQDFVLTQDLTVPAGVTLQVGYSYNPNEPFPQYGLTVPAGFTVTNNGTINVLNCAYLYNYGTIANNGNIINNGTYKNEGTVTGNRVEGSGIGASGELTQAEFEAALAEAEAAETGYALNGKVTLEKNLTIDLSSYNGFTVSYLGELIVPSGVTLTLNTNTYMRGGKITVQGGGKLVFNNVVDHANGTLTVEENGTVEGTIWYYPGNSGCYVNGIPNSQLHALFFVNSEAELLAAIDNEAGYGYVEIIPSSEFTLTQSVTIPANMALNVAMTGMDGSGVDLTVASMLTINGNLYVSNNNALNIDLMGGMLYVGENGYVGNYGGIYCEPSFHNYGIVDNYGIIWFAASGVRQGDGIWNGNAPVFGGDRPELPDNPTPPVVEGITTQDELEAKLNEARENLTSYDFYGNVTLERDLEMAYSDWDQNIDCNVYVYGDLTVPAGKTLTINGCVYIVGGSINVEYDGKLVLGNYGHLELVQGSLYLNSNAILEKSQDKLIHVHPENNMTITGVPYYQQYAQIHVNSWEELAVAERNENGYGRLLINPTADITLADSLSLSTKVDIGLIDTELVIPAGQTMMINSSINVAREAKLTVEPEAYLYTTESGWLSIFGNVENNGTVYNWGTTEVYGNGSITGDGFWGGNEPIYYTDPEPETLVIASQADMDAFLAAAQEGVLVTDANISVTGQVTLNATVILQNTGTLTVESGAELTIPADFDLASEAGTSVVVKDGGKIVNYGGLAANMGTVSVENPETGYVHNEGAEVIWHHDYGNHGTITGIPTEYWWINGIAGNAEQISVLNELADSGAYGAVTIQFFDPITFANSVDGPPVEIYVSPNAPWHVYNDITVEESAWLIINQGAQLKLYGNEIVIDGQLTNYGTLDMMGGTITVTPGDYHWFTNAGNLEAGGATISIGGTFDSNTPLFLIDGAVLTVDGLLNSYGPLHVGYPTENDKEDGGQLNVGGTMNNYGYLNVCDGAKVNIDGVLNNTFYGEDLAGFIENHGQINVNGSVNLEAVGINQSGTLLIDGIVNVRSDLDNNGRTVLQSNENGGGRMFVYQGGRLDLVDCGKFLVQSGAVLRNGELNEDGWTIEGTHGDVRIRMGTLYVQGGGDILGPWDGHVTWENGEGTGTTDNHLSAWSLNNPGDGWYLELDWGYSWSHRMLPGDENWFVVYENIWHADEENADYWWERNPIGPEVLDADNLQIERIEDMDGENIAEGQNSFWFLHVTAGENWGVDTGLTYNGMTYPVYIGRDMTHGYYSAPEATDANWLERITVDNISGDPQAKTVYFILTDENWVMDGEHWLNLPEGVHVESEYMNDGKTIRITIPAETIRSMTENFWMDVSYNVRPVSGGDPETWGWGIDVCGIQLHELSRDAWMWIDDTDYNYNAENDVWMMGTGEGPVLADLPEGLSYDFATNTLTMDNAHLSGLEVGYYGWNENGRNDEWADLPSQELTIELIGENSIISYTDSALRAYRGVKLEITGDGSLHLAAHHGDEGFHNEDYTEFWDGSAIGIGNEESSLTISGNAKVTAEVSGRAYYMENGEKRDGNIRTIGGHYDSSSLTVKDNAQLTTVVPEGAVHNNYADPADGYTGGYRGIVDFASITVQDNAVLNTQDLEIGSGTYTQTGGYVTIQPLGHVAPHEQNNSVAHTHMDGLRVGQNSTATVTGGTLEIRIPDTSTESTWYRGISLDGGTLNIGGDARIEVWTNGSGNAINLDNAWDDYGNPIEGGSTLNMTGGTLMINGGIWQENDVVTGEPYMTRPVAIWTNDQSVANFENGRINAYNVIFEFNGTTTWGFGGEESWPVLHGEKVYFGAGGPDFKVNSGCIELIGGYNQVGGEEQFFFGIFDAYGNVEINGGSIFLNDGVFGAGNATALNGGEIDISNQVTGTEGLYIGGYFAINGGSLNVTTPGGTAYNREGELITVPAVWVDGTFHQMGGSVNISCDSAEGIHNYGSVLVNNGTLSVSAATAMISEYSENGWFFVNQADPDRNTAVILQGRDLGLVARSSVEIMGGNVFVTAYGEANEETGFAPAAILLEAVYDEEGNLVMVPDSPEDPMVHLAVVGGYLYASCSNGTAIVADNAPIIIHDGENGAKPEMTVHGDVALRTYSPDENTGIRTDYPFENMNGDVLSMDQELHEESGWYINTLMDGENIATDARAAYKLTQEDLVAEIAKAKAEGTLFVLAENFTLTDDLVIDCQFKINPNVRLTVPEGMTLTITDEVTEDASFDIYGMLEVQGTLDVNGYLYNAGQIDNYGLVTGNGTIFNGTTFHTTHGNLEFNGFLDGYPPIDEGNFDDIATDVWMRVNGMDVEYAAAEDLWLTWGEHGREVVDMAELGLSYNYDTNTLTLDNASLSGLEVGYYGWDDEANAPALDENGDYTWNDLPNENLTINLVGASTINSTELKDHALKIYRGVKLDITGDGSLYVVTDNGEGFYGEDENSHWWWSCAPVNLGGDDCGLTLSGKAKVTVQVSGKGAYSDENGDKRVGYLGAIQGGGSSLTINDQAALTTILPENALRYDDINGTGGYEAINGFDSITVNGGTLNTQFIGVGQTFTQNGGTVNITALGGLQMEDKYQWNDETQRDEYVATVEHTHFDGIHTNGGNVTINGGSLNITIPDNCTTDSMWYRGIAMNSGNLTIGGSAVVTIDGPENRRGTGIELSCAYSENGPIAGTKATFTMDGGKLVMKEANIREENGNYEMTHAIWGDGNAEVTVNGGEWDLDAVYVELNGKTTWNDGVMNGEEVIFVAGGPEFVINGGTFNLTGKPIEGDDQVFSNALFRAWGMVTMNGGTMNIVNGVLGVPTAFELNGGDITINNDDQFNDCWGLILPITENGAGYMAVNRGSLSVSIIGMTHEEQFDNAPAAMINGTFHQMGGTVSFTSQNTAAIKSFGSVLVNGGEMYLTGTYGIGQFYNEYNLDGQFFVNGGKLQIEASDTGIFANNSPVVFRQGDNGENPQVAINAAGAAIQLLTDGEESGFVSDYSLINQEGKRLVLETRDRRDEEYVGCYVHTLMEDGAYAKYAQLHQVPIMTQDEFLEAMRAAAASDNKAVVVNGPVVIESDLTLESTVIVRDGGSLTVIGGTLTIPNQWDLAAEHDGVILADGGYIRNEGMLAANGGSIHIRTENGYEHIQIEGAARETQMHNWYYPGTGASDVSGIDLQLQSLRANLETADQLQGVNAVEDLSAYGSVVVELLSSMTLDMFYTIPANVSVNMGGGRMLTVSENVTLTVEGSLFVHDGAVLMVYGTVNNNGSLHVGIWQDGSHEFSGTMVVEAGGVANLRGYTCIHGLQAEGGEMPDYYPGNMQVYGTVNTYAKLPEGSSGTGTGGYIQNGGILNIHNGGVINSGFLFSADAETNVFAGGTLNHNHEMFVTGMLNVTGTVNNTGAITVENENHDAMIHVDGKLVNGGQLNIADSVIVRGELENNGTVTVNGLLDNQSAVYNNGQIDVYGTMNTDGTVTNSNITHVYTGGMLTGSGNWVGYAPVNMGGTISGSAFKLTQDKLEAAIAAAKAGGYEFVLTERFALERALTIDCQFTVAEGVELIVAENTPLMVTGETVMTNNGKITVKSYLGLDSNVILYNNGQIDAYAAFDAGSASVMCSGIVNVYTGGSLGSDGIWEGNAPVNQGGEIYGSAFGFTQDQLEAGMEAAAGLGYPYKLPKDFTLERDLKISSNVVIPADVTLTVPAGLQLIIEPAVTEDNAFEVYGQLIVNGTMRILGYVYNDGQILDNGIVQCIDYIEENGVLKGMGTLVNNTTFQVNAGAMLNFNGTWEGYAPINNGGIVIGSAFVLTQDKLEAALAEAAANGYEFVLTESFTLERDLTVDAYFRVDDGISLTVPEGITLTVAKGEALEVNGSLNNNGTVEVEGRLAINGTGNNNDTVNVWQGGWISGNGAWNGNEPVNMGGGTISGSAFAITEAEFLAGVAKAEAEGTEYVLSVPVTLTHDLTIGGRFTIATSGKLTVAKNAVLNVSESAVFVNHGTLDVVGTANVDSVFSGEQTDPTTTWYGFTNNGQIDVRGKMTINGEMDNANGHYGWMNGTTIHVYKGGHLHADGVWTGYAPMVDEGGKVTGTATFYTELRLMNAMNGFAAQGIPMVLRIPYTMIFDMDIAGDVTIAEGVTFTIPEGMTLTIPEGAILTVRGELINNGNIVVEGILNAEGYVINNGKTSVTGTLTANGSWGGNRPSGNYSGSAFALTQDNLELWMGSGYTLDQSFTLERDMIINGNLSLGDNGVLIIPAGKTLTIDAATYIVIKGRIVNNGTMLVKNTLNVSGEFINNGTVNVLGTLNVLAENAPYTMGEYNNNGTTTILSGGVLNMNGIWTGNLPVNEGGTVNGMLLTQADLEKAMAEVDSYTLETSFELTEDLFIDNELVIPEGVTLTVPTGISVWVNGNLVNHGTILVDGALRVINTMTNGETGTLEFHGSGIITGTVENDGTANVYTGAVLSGRGDWNGNDPMNLGGTITGKAFELHHEEFLDLLANGETLNEIFTLEKSLTIDSELTIGENGQLVIPAGMTLTVAEGNRVYVDGGSIVAETGARIRNYGVLENKLGIINVQSSNGYTGTGGVMNHYVDGVLSQISGIPAAKQYIMAQCSSMDYVQNLKGLLGSDIGAYVDIQVELTGSSTMSYNMTIDENMLLSVFDHVELYIPGNVILTVNGRLSLNNSRLVVNGKLNVTGQGTLLTCNGTYTEVNGELNNKGFSELGYVGGTSAVVINGKLTNSGEMIIGSSCAVENHGTLNNSGEIQVCGTITSNGTLVNTGTYSGGCGEDLSWTLADNTLEITGKGDMTDAPWNGLSQLTAEVTNIKLSKRVNALCENAFAGFGKVTELTVPGTVREIGANAIDAHIKLKVACASAAFDYAEQNGNETSVVHTLDEESVCMNCDYSLNKAIEEAESTQDMVDAFKNVDTDALKDQIQQELENGEANISALVQMVEQEITEGNEEFIDAAVDAAKDIIKDTFDGKITSENVVGAALSALEGVDKVTLIISDPKQEPELGADVAADTSLVFNMTLEGVEDAKNLNAPVTIRLPIPANATYEGGKVVIWHFRDGVSEEYEKILAMVEDGMAVFAVSSFSHFAFPAEANIYVGETGFATMAAAVAAAAESGETITVKNVPEDAAYEIPAAVTVQVLGGVSYEVKAAAGFQTVKNADGTVSVEREPVAKIGETGYPTLEAAIEAAQENDTIVLVKSIEAEVTVDKAVVINRNGNTAVIKADLGYIAEDLGESVTIRLATAVIYDKDDAAKSTSYATLAEALKAAESMEDPVITLQAVPEDGIVFEQAVSIKAPNIPYTIVCGKGWEAIEEIGGIVRIQKDPDAEPVAQVGDVTFTSLEEAVAAADGEIIDLLADIGSVTISQTATINTNGWDIEITAGEGFKTKLDGSVFYVYEENLFLFAGANILAGDSLDMYFWIKKADLAGSTDYYAIVRRTYGDGREDVVKRIPYSEWEDKTSMMRICFPGLAAKEMTDEIYITIYRGDNVQVSHQRVDSIKMYTMRNLEDPTTESKLCTVLVDMLNYGAAAQVYFDGYSVDDLATDGIDEYQKYATEEIRYEDRREKGPNYIGSTVSTESELILTFYFQKITKDMTAYITYTNSYNTEKTIVIPGSEFHNYTSTILGARVHGLAVSDGRQLVKCEIKDAEGKVVASAVDSIESYIARSIEDDVIFGLMLKFIDSAYDYFR